MTEKKKKNFGGISRREFLRDAGVIIGTSAIGSTVLLAACGGETTTETVTSTKTVTSTAPGGTTTVTTTAPGTGASTVTQTISKFVCPIDGQEFDTLAELQAHFEAEHGEAAVALNVVTLNVNGSDYELQVEPHWTLHHVLRDELGFTSVKAMCSGYGACGACSIIMNGRPVLSCMMLAIECNGATIETAEGVSKSKPELIDAYVTYHCMQCGYCTPGFVVTAKALLDNNSNPTSDEILHALSGNLCRCGTYQQHVLAVLEAAKTGGM